MKPYLIIKLGTLLDMLASQHTTLKNLSAEA